MTTVAQFKAQVLAALPATQALCGADRDLRNLFEETLTILNLDQTLLDSIFPNEAAVDAYKAAQVAKYQALKTAAQAKAAALS